MKHEDIIVDMLNRIEEKKATGEVAPYFIYYDEIDAIKSLVNYKDFNININDHNSFIDFINDRCLIADEYHVSLAEFKQRYNFYCKCKNVKPIKLNKQIINSYITHYLGEGLFKCYGKYMIPNLSFKTNAYMEMEEYLQELINDREDN